MKSKIIYSYFNGHVKKHYKTSHKYKGFKIIHIRSDDNFVYSQVDSDVIDITAFTHPILIMCKGTSMMNNLYALKKEINKLNIFT